MCTLTDVVDGASTELSVELLGPESPEVVNGVGPEVEHIVPGEGVSFFNHHHLAAQQSQLDGRPKATRTAADDQTLNGRRLQLEWESIISNGYLIKKNKEKPIDSQNSTKSQTAKSSALILRIDTVLKERSPTQP